MVRKALKRSIAVADQNLQTIARSINYQVQLSVSTKVRNHRTESAGKIIGCPLPEGYIPVSQEDVHGGISGDGGCEVELSVAVIADNRVRTRLKCSILPNGSERTIPIA
jgi:hypothetical protein